MKRLTLLCTGLFLAAVIHGQVSAGPELVTGNRDVIGLNGWPYEPFMVQSGPDQFYWVSGTNLNLVDHPLLQGITNDFSHLYFLRYDDSGKALDGNFIRGAYAATGVFPHNDRFYIVGGSNQDVSANGNIVPINNANRLEFIAQYNDRSQFLKIIPVWNLEPSRYPYSLPAMDPLTGSIYLVGGGYTPLTVDGHGVIGEGYQDYLYILKYGPDLELAGVYTFGFDETAGEYGYFGDVVITPDVRGNVLISARYEGDRSPVIEGDTLPAPDPYGVMVLKLTPELKKEWVLTGPLATSGYGTGTAITEGMAMRNGDVVFTGVTTTGQFQLGNLKISIPGGADFTNHFAFRMTPGGEILWVRTLAAMGEYYGEKRAPHGRPDGAKETDSDKLQGSFDWDAMQYNNQVLYMTGKFLSDSFDVAGRTLNKKYANGIFVAAVDLNNGEELWGYSLSSNFTRLHGFDADASGNVSLMGETGYLQDFQGLGTDSVPGTDLIFHLGLGFDGKPIWKNNAYLENKGFSVYGTDLEVLRDGEVFSSMYKGVPDPLLIAGSSITSQYDYTAMMIPLRADTRLGGQIVDKSGVPVFSGSVSALKFTGRGAYPTVATSPIDDAGGYIFEGLLPGSYTLKAIPGKEAYPDGMPTYLGGAIAWEEAQPLELKPDTKADFVGITLSELPPLTSEDGSGEVSGNVSFAENVEVLKGTLAKPVTRTSVILIKKAASKGTLEDDVVAYVETDDLGNYVFENVPDGDYVLIVDVPGIPMIQTYDVTILGNQIVAGLDFTVANEGIGPKGTVDAPSVPVEEFSVFPNPGNGWILATFPEGGEYTVSVYNAAGSVVDRQEVAPSGGTFPLDLTHLQEGFYFLRIQGQGRRATVKYIRK